MNSSSESGSDPAERSSMPYPSSTMRYLISLLLQCSRDKYLRQSPEMRPRSWRNVEQELFNQFGLRFSTETHQSFSNEWNVDRPLTEDNFKYFFTSCGGDDAFELIIKAAECPEREAYLYALNMARCGACSKKIGKQDAPLMTCGSCPQAYCDPMCLTIHWNNHKYDCGHQHLKVMLNGMDDSPLAEWSNRHIRSLSLDAHSDGPNQHDLLRVQQVLNSRFNTSPLRTMWATLVERFPDAPALIESYSQFDSGHQFMDYEPGWFEFEFAKMIITLMAEMAHVNVELEGLPLLNSELYDVAIPKISGPDSNHFWIEHDKACIMEQFLRVGPLKPGESLSSSTRVVQVNNYIRTRLKIFGDAVNKLNSSEQNEYIAWVVAALLWRAALAGHSGAIEYVVEFLSRHNLDAAACCMYYEAFRNALCHPEGGFHAVNLAGHFLRSFFNCKRKKTIDFDSFISRIPNPPWEKQAWMHYYSRLIHALACYIHSSAKEIQLYEFGDIIGYILMTGVPGIAPPSLKTGMYLLGNVKDLKRAFPMEPALVLASKLIDGPQPAAGSSVDRFKQKIREIPFPFISTDTLIWMYTYRVGLGGSECQRCRQHNMNPRT